MCQGNLARSVAREGRFLTPNVALEIVSTAPKNADLAKTHFATAYAMQEWDTLDPARSELFEMTAYRRRKACRRRHLMTFDEDMTRPTFRAESATFPP